MSVCGCVGFWKEGGRQAAAGTQSDMAQVALIKNTLREEIPKFLAEMGQEQHLSPFTAHIDPVLLKRGNRVDITSATVRQERVYPVDGQSAQPGRKGQGKSRHRHCRAKSASCFNALTLRCGRKSSFERPSCREVCSSWQYSASSLVPHPPRRMLPRDPHGHPPRICKGRFR